MKHEPSGTHTYPEASPQPDEASAPAHPPRLAGSLSKADYHEAGSEQPKPLPASPCPKCDGAGWLWGEELDTDDPVTLADTMTRYTCDLCKGTRVDPASELDFMLTAGLAL